MEKSINHFDLTGICRTLHPTITECTFFGAQDVFTKIDHELGHKTSLKFKKIDITENTFSDHSETKLEISKKTRKSPYIWQLSNTLLNNSSKKKSPWKLEDILN